MTTPVHIDALLGTTWIWEEAESEQRWAHIPDTSDNEERFTTIPPWDPSMRDDLIFDAK